MRCTAHQKAISGGGGAAVDNKAVTPPYKPPRQRERAAGLRLLVAESRWGFCCRFQFFKTADFHYCAMICGLLEASCWVLSCSLAEYRGARIWVVKDSSGTAYSTLQTVLWKCLACALIFLLKKNGICYNNEQKRYPQPVAEVRVSLTWTFFKNSVSFHQSMSQSLQALKSQSLPFQFELWSGWKAKHVCCCVWKPLN